MTRDELREMADFIAKEIVIVNKDVLTSREAAIYLGVSLSCLYKWTMERVVPHYKPNGKMCYFNRKELEQWMQNNKVC